MNYLDKDEAWLEGQLQSQSMSLDNISDITLATYTKERTLAIDTDHPNDKQKGPQYYKPGMNN
ncbi:hypothetical protein NC797_11540 [Aquibacillus sp. 3ASR75-11]|uniref:Uncharacterized protein n=1 Tax=Terrihalobacillus insolitus TaxID=2950438 RepID=A0A9X4AP31_9BACI|nr:hypothetical protein [Terrihalobacillus insolitus]MDC3425138.1 hypothetical protein [Terrihalobacillus insolitus]